MFQLEQALIYCFVKVMFTNIFSKSCKNQKQILYYFTCFSKLVKYLSALTLNSKVCKYFIFSSQTLYPDGNIFLGSG